MVLKTYAYKVGKMAFLLDETEWQALEPLLRNRLKNIIAYRDAHKVSLNEAVKCSGREALYAYEKLTGVRLDHPDELWGLRMKDYGAICPKCSRPFRSPRAKLCAECGYTLPAGNVAGPLCVT